MKRITETRTPKLKHLNKKNEITLIHFDEKSRLAKKMELKAKDFFVNMDR